MSSNPVDTVIRDVRTLEPGEGIVAAWVRIRQGRIVELGPCSNEPRDVVEWIDGGGRLLTPGLIDLHTHGLDRFGYEAGPEQLVEATRRLGKFGVTSVLPTLYRCLTRRGLGEVEKLAAALDAVTGVCAPGLHLEGPFLALPGAGAETIPGDLGLLEELLAAAAGKTRVMSISPEVPGILPIIERLCELKIVPFITHTAATAEQTQAAIEAGARHATHFYDVFPAPPETDPGVRAAGVVEALLADPRCTVDFIADGVHVAPVTVKALLAAKGYRNVMLITDSNVGAGLPPGVYASPMGEIVTERAARLHRPGTPVNGILAGSTLTLDRAVGNILSWFDPPEEQAWALATSNPARLMHWESKGTLRVGADADLVLWDQTAGRPRAVRTWVEGRCVYENPRL
jgi:N-acetylglucosamine-6-phosphate deacetylase